MCILQIDLLKKKNNIHREQDTSAALSGVLMYIERDLNRVK